jgi:protein-tyrosine-phosphatase
MVKKILFICKHNRFRSKVAEAYFKKINKNKTYCASSAGIIKHSAPFDKNQFNVAKSMGIIMKGPSRNLSEKLLEEQDIIINVADDVPEVLFNNKSYIKGEVYNWKIPDVLETTKIKAIEKTIQAIMKRIGKLEQEI